MVKSDQLGLRIFTAKPFRAARLTAEPLEVSSLVVVPVDVVVVLVVTVGAMALVHHFLLLYELRI